MEILILLIPLALLLLAVAIFIFFWALKNDQFDDMDSPSWRILFDDREQQHQETPSAETDTRPHTTSSTDQEKS